MGMVLFPCAPENEPYNMMFEHATECEPSLSEGARRLHRMLDIYRAPLMAVCV